ncbi:MAG: DUF2142 domain-containing protein [Coriobacteriales bacterium]|nr:DUF2142 domain-containing protein [Coriobacteriales bacterium]
MNHSQHLAQAADGAQVRLAHPAGIRPHWVLPFIMLAYGLCLALILPVGVGPDEPQHIGRVDQIARGGLLSSAVDASSLDAAYAPTANSADKLYGGVVDRGLMTLAMDNMRVFHGTQDRTTFAELTTHGTQDQYRYGATSEPFAFSNACVYSPFVYLPHLVGHLMGRLLFGNALGIIWCMRIASVLVVVALATLLVRQAPWGAWTLALIFCLPSVMGCASFVSADTMTTMVCVAFLASLAWMLTGDNRASTRRILIASTCVLGLVKVVYILLLPLLALVLLDRRKKDPRTCRQLLIAAGVGAALFVLWFLLVGGINTGAMFKAEVSPDKQLAYVLQHPLRFCVTMVNTVVHANVFQLGANSVISFHEKGELTFTAFALLAAVLADLATGVPFPQGRQKLRRVIVVFVAMFVALFGAIALSLYLQFTAVGAATIEGVQTRYFAPLLPLILYPLLLMLASGEENEVGPNAGSVQAPLAAHARGTAAFAAVSLLCVALSNIFILVQAVF